jgi:hypothetical protein
LLLFFKKEALSCRGASEESKRFFFEKKKQKTFVRLKWGIIFSRWGFLLGCML